MGQTVAGISAMRGPHHDAYRHRPTCPLPRAHCDPTVPESCIRDLYTKRRSSPENRRRRSEMNECADFPSTSATQMRTGLAPPLRPNAIGQAELRLRQKNHSTAGGDCQLETKPLARGSCNEFL